MNKLWKRGLTVLLALALILTSFMPWTGSTVTDVQAASDAVINLASKKQEIRGIGGMNHTTWIGDLTASQRETAFGNGTNQLGFSVLRIHVDENKNNWSKEVATAKAAIAKGAIVFASPWNPPAEMCEKFTRNGQPNQNRLKYSSYGAYANWLNDFVTYMKNNGVNLYAISVQNEPDYAHTWTWWTSSEMLNFMKNYAGKINCRVMAPESFQYQKPMYDAILNDPTALANTDIVATHFYGTQKSQMSYPLFQQKGAGKELWMTEVYVPNSTSDADTWPEAVDVAKNMHDGFVTGNMQTYVWWYIRRSYGPMKENGQISKRGYCMAQYSKFVRPGYKRVDATENPNTNIWVSAYTGDNKAVIVAVNKGNSQVTQKFTVQNGTIGTVDRYRTSGSENLAKTANLELSGNGFWASLPANSVSTFVCTLGGAQATVAPTQTPTVAPTPTAKPGNITNGYYYIKNVGSQKYLQVKDNIGKNVQNIEIGTGTGVDGQKWYLENKSNGYVTLKSALGDYMIDIANGADEDGANVQLYSAYGGDAQQFQILSTATNGVYTIVSKASKGTKALDCYGHGTTDGTNVVQWTLGGKPNQQWVFEAVSSTPTVQPTTNPTSTPTTQAPTVKPSVTPTQSSGTSGLPSGVTAEYKVVSDWGSSFQGEIVIKNNSTKTFNGWTLTCNYNSSIQNLWGAELVGQSGTKVTIKNPSWDATLAPGASVSINFIANAGSDKNAPTGYTFG